MMMEKIKSDTDYSNVMSQINGLMAKGSSSVTREELDKIRELALSVQDYEQNKYVVESPSNLAGMIEMRMYEMQLKQKDLAKKLKISHTKLSLIMTGKQKPDIEFLKAVYSKLNVDATFIMEHA